jgi:WD40-like Beta Propeller Repeat
MRARIIVPLLVVALAGVAQAQDFGKNKVRYDTFNWEVFSTPHFRISFYERERSSLGKIASFAESAYDDLARKLNFQISDPIPLIAYATHAEFEETNTIVEFIPEGVGAFALPARNRMVLPIDVPDAELQKLIRHELTHVFQYEILYQGKLGKALIVQPPQWFMEGMASYLGNDEDSRAKAVMRDAVLSDEVPSIEDNVSGYFAYRFGHMVFEFVESEWGLDGLRDFIFEVRNTLGGQIGKAIKRAFDLDVEEFDARFRTWLRKHYQKAALDCGTPREFGPPFRVKEEEQSVETSPAASPSGDLIAAFSTYKDRVDVVLLGVPNRTLFRHLAGGFTTDYQYLVAQLLTVGPDRGGDLSFSPSGDRVAVFARRGKGRSLLLLDALHGGIKREIPVSPDQAMSPAYSPDGETIAFHAIAGGHADIFLLDLASGKVSNLTQDDAYDSSPVYTPDGQHIVYSSQSGETAKLFEISLANPKEREQLTFGAGNDEGAAFSKDGKRLYFASDRDSDIFDIYGLDLADHSLIRLTHVIGAAVNPVPVPTRDGERVIYQAYSKGRWQLYLTDPAQGKPAGKEEKPEEVTKREAYVPSVSVAVTPEKIKPVKRHKLFIDDAQVLVGVNTDNVLISQTYLSFSDQYGDRRFLAMLDSVEGYSNFRFAWINLAKRLQWGVWAYDDRAYYLAPEDIAGRTTRFRQAYRITGASFFVQYPLSLYHRVEGSVGFDSWDVTNPISDPQSPIGVSFVTQKSNSPWVSASLIGDTTQWREYGPHAGRRWSIGLNDYYDTSNGGTLSREASLDVRQYLPISRRNELAIRLVAAASTGNQPQLTYFGGLDTLRGFDYQSLVGNRTGYLNLEWRFPLIDYLILPWLHLRGLRGRVFLDVGAAYFDIGGQKFTFTDQGIVPGFTFMDHGRLVNGVSSYGLGFTVNIFGLPMHWDFAKRWDFKRTLSKGTTTSFWIGYRY